MTYANRGKGFEEEVRLTNNQYRRKGRAFIQQIPTPVKITKVKGAMIEGFVEGKSTLDFRGTVNPGISVSFDCKETKDERGLPLANIQKHQIKYISDALSVGEKSFILCYMSKIDKRYYIPGEKVLEYWDRWQANKGKRGYNFIPEEEMIEVKSANGLILDYLGVVI